MKNLDAAITPVLWAFDLGVTVLPIRLVRCCAFSVRNREMEMKVEIRKWTLRPDIVLVSFTSSIRLVDGFYR